MYDKQNTATVKLTVAQIFEKVQRLQEDVSSLEEALGYTLPDTKAYEILERALTEETQLLNTLRSAACTLEVQSPGKLQHFFLGK